MQRDEVIDESTDAESAPMDQSVIAVEDFQEYYTHSVLSDAESSSPLAAKNVPSHEIIEDTASLSDSVHGHSSGADDEAVFDGSATRGSSPRTSHGSSDEEISVLESAYCSSRNVSGAPLTPSKTHSPFHQPSSVRAMQLDTTPPHLATPSSQRKRFNTPSRQMNSPRSARSGHRSTPSKLMNSSPIKSVRKEHPLILLHITILPIPHNYSLEILETVLPPTTFANWKLLLERTNPTVLHRGILVPHPREDYDVLEERLLESLELKQPRILKCGHFHLSTEEEADIEASDDEEEEDLDDVDICGDCGRRIRDGRLGDAGTGSKRWDVKVFAANGLMRAGAWSAAWKEMERVDVEILPWMEESMKRELELRSEEEEKFKKERDIARNEEGVAGLDDERLREIYGQDASIRGTPAKERTQDDVDGLPYDTPLKHHTSHEMPRSPSQSPFKFGTAQHQIQEAPLWDLIRNYLYLAAQDPRNVAIWILSGVVLCLALHSSTSMGASIPSMPIETSAHIIPTAMAATTPSIAGEIVRSLTDGGPSTTNEASISTLELRTSSTGLVEPKLQESVNEDTHGDAEPFETAEDVTSELLED